jgi:hypothetical protein
MSFAPAAGLCCMFGDTKARNGVPSLVQER